MKNIFTVLSFILFTSLSTYATTTNPVTGDDNLVLDNTEASFTWERFSSVVSNTTYNEFEQYFTIETEKTINFLQVLNAAGDVDYLLPIGAKVLKLALSDFEKGAYRINLLVEGESKFLTTELVKKS